MNDYNSNNNDNEQPNNINFVNNKKSSKNSLEQKQVKGKEEIFKNSDNYELGNENNLKNLNDNNININNENTKVIKSKNLNENQNNNRINSILSINNNNYAQNHLETVLETINEVSCSRFDSSKLSDNNCNNNENKNKNINNNIIDVNNSNFKENNEIKQKTKDEAIIISEQKIQYSENNTTALATLAANNTKKSLYLFKSEKTD